MVYSKELERDVTTTAVAKGLLCLKTLASFLHRTWRVWFFYIQRTNKGCYVHAMCQMLLFWAKTGKTSAYFLRFDIKLKKSCSGFDLDTVLISKLSFFQHRVSPVKQGKSYLHGIELPDFYIVSSFFYKKSNQARVPPFVWLFRDDATSADRSRMWRRNKFMLMRLYCWCPPVHVNHHFWHHFSETRVKTSNFGRFFAVSLLQHGLCFAPDMWPG